MSSEFEKPTCKAPSNLYLVCLDNKFRLDIGLILKILQLNFYFGDQSFKKILAVQANSSCLSSFHTSIEPLSNIPMQPQGSPGVA